MPRRKDLIYRPDDKLDRRAAELQLALAENREQEQALLEERNRLWFEMFHAHGYAQRRIREVSNALLPSNHPGLAQDTTVEKALARMR